MPLPLLATKLFIPAVRKELVPRPRLTARLWAGLDRRVTLVSAPAGFGKTTLLAAWIAESCLSNRQPTLPGRFCWLSLDKADNDPVRFWCHLIGALRTVQPGIGASALEGLQSPQPVPVDSLLPTLINEIALLPGRVILVLDDFHEISGQAIHEGLVFLLENLPPSLHLVVASRADPPWPLARLRARGQVNELRTQDLRFTAQEAASFLNGVTGLSLTPGDIESLDERTEGWIAGLQLAAVSLQGRENPSAFVQAFSGSHRFVLDYLAEEVLSRQDPSMQEFLLKTSILERMNAPLCDAVLGESAEGSSDSAARLDYLEKGNLFVVPLDDERGWYRYHHLFADLLRARLAQSMPDQVPALHLRASAWLERAGLLEEAIAQALASGDMERAACLVEQTAMRMFVEERPVTLSRWLEAMPEDVVRARPWLCVYHAFTHHWVGLREQVEEWLLSAETALASLPEATTQPESCTAALGLTPEERRSLVGHITGIRAYNLLTSGDLPRVMELVPQALALLPEGEYIRTTIAIALGGALWGQGDVLAAQRAFETARENALKGGYRYWSVPSACYVGMLQTKQGLLHEAFETYRGAKELASAPGGYEVPVAGFPSVKMGDLLREWNDLPAASQLVGKGVELCVALGQADVITDAYVALARLQLAQGKPGLVGETLRKADDLAKRSSIDPFVLCWLEDCRVRTLLAVGDLDGAARWARESGLTVDGELSYHFDLHHVNLARVLVARGAADPSGPWLGDALRLTDRTLAAAERAGWVHEEIKIRILQALAMEARGDSPGALEALWRALELAQPGGYVRVFVDEGEPLRALLKLIPARMGKRIRGGGPANEGDVQEYALRLLAAYLGPAGVASRPEATVASAAGLIEPLSEREMEVLRLLATSLSSPDIAAELVVSVNTVRTHIKSIYGKLAAHGRLAAVDRARELKLI